MIDPDNTLVKDLAAIDKFHKDNHQPTMQNKHTPDIEGIVEIDCEKYEHIPEPYDVAFWHCKVCKKELVFVTLESLQSQANQYEREKGEMVRAFIEQGRRAHDTFGDSFIREDDIKTIAQKYGVDLSE